MNFRGCWSIIWDCWVKLEGNWQSMRLHVSRLLEKMKIYGFILSATCHEGLRLSKPLAFEFAACLLVSWCLYAAAIMLPSSIVYWVVYSLFKSFFNHETAHTFAGQVSLPYPRPRNIFETCVAFFSLWKGILKSSLTAFQLAKYVGLHSPLKEGTGKAEGDRRELVLSTSSTGGPWPTISEIYNTFLHMWGSTSID